MPRRLPPPLRLALAGLVLVAAVASLLAGPARAEEALILENGAVLRGTVVREDDREVLFQLAGVGKESRVTVERSRIVQRFTTVDPRRAPTPAPVEPDPAPNPDGPPTLVRPATPPATAAPAPEAGEPPARAEDFFSRTARRAEMALPGDTASRAFLSGLAVLVVLGLVALAGRMVDVQAMTLGRATLLAVLFVGLVSIDVAWADTMLRADRAGVIVPVQLLAWVGCAAGSLRCGLGRAFNLLAFVLLSSALVVFSAGIVLVSV